MVKSVKKVLLSCISVLGVSTLVWIVLLLNPSLCYSHETQFDNITVFHSSPLESNTDEILKNAVNILEQSDLFDKDMRFELCLNDGSIYPKINFIWGQPLAFAMFDKTVIKNCTANFEKNIAEAKWEVNDFEYRTFDLTELLAHEFMHNLQNNADFSYVIASTKGRYINWKLEGHAEYISKQFKNDGALKEKIDKYLQLEKERYIGFPVFDGEDGHKQSLTYYKYALVVQYLMEQKGLDFAGLCDSDKSLDESYDEMLQWKAM